MSVRVRFAPSPTGFLHVGGVRTALFNYLFAKKHSGSFILRLEDTDQERFVPEGVAQIVESLDWLGLKPDEGFWIHEGKHQNIDYIQSERLKTGLYTGYADKLVAAGLAYFSPTTPAELDQLRQATKQAKQPFLYRRQLDKKNSATKLKAAPIRLDIAALAAKGVSANWKDGIRGEFNEDPSLIDDFILVKSDGFPTYNFANVIDDYEMKISHVIRGDEFIASTAKHVLLYQALGFKAIPEFIHLPSINGQDGKKLSKRTGDTNVLDYKAKGYLPHAILNFLALLGWNDGTEQELFSPEELIEKFSLERIQKSPAVFDPERLNWFNGSYIRQANSADLTAAAEPFWPKNAAKTDTNYKQKAIEVSKERLKYLAEISELTDFFFETPTLNAKHKQEIWRLFENAAISASDWLRQAAELFTDSDYTNRQVLEQKLRAAITELGDKPAALFGVLRIALTAKDSSPPIWDVMWVLGKAESLKRLEAAAKIL